MKIVHANQAKSIYKFNNIKLKPLHCNASICFNKMCQKLNIRPKYAQLKCKIKSSNKTNDEHIINKLHKLRINNEIMSLHKRKQLLNIRLYKANLTNAKE
jgi:hypothetical protein